MALGYLNLVLHAHLPFVRHPEYCDSFEERWLFEAITETYIPLLLTYESLIRRDIRFKITMSLTPPLMEMLSDELLQNRYMRHMENLMELAEKEKIRTKNDPDFHATALMYQRKFRQCYDFFVGRCGKNLLRAFREIRDYGALEIITCCATHGFLPIMSVHPEAVRAQIDVGAANYRKHMGSSPRGIWLAECGYYPGHDLFLQRQGIRFFFVDSHGLLLARPKPPYAIYSPVLCPESGVAALARDPDSSRQVWSSIEGYPGDFNYREFYRDAGYDLPMEYIAPHIHESGTRINTGVKYYRITGKTEKKEPYHEERAVERTRAHARHFVSSRIEQCRELAQAMDRPPLITCPYDAELYGHWWYEGPRFIQSLFEEIHRLNYEIEPVTAMDYLEWHPHNPEASPSMSSWGHNGYCEFWLDECNDWIYRHLHKAQQRMIDLACQYREEKDPLRIRALNQAARELLLAQSSDWAFIIRSATCVEYAEKRTRDHLINFTELFEEIEKGEINIDFLEDIEDRNNIFREIDFRVYC